MLLLLHLVGCLYYLYQWCTVKQISNNEKYLLIKYIEIDLWKVAKHLSYMEDERCLKVKSVWKYISFQGLSASERITFRLKVSSFPPYFFLVGEVLGHAVTQLVDALRCKSEGSIPDGVIGIFHWHNPSGRTMALGLTQPLTEMSTRNVSWGQRRPVPGADNLTTFMCRLSWNFGTSTSWNPLDMSRPVMGLLYLLGEVLIWKWVSIGYCKGNANYPPEVNERTFQ